MELYKYLTEEENKQDSIEVNNPESYFKRLNLLKETLEQLMDLTDEEKLKKIQSSLNSNPNLNSIIKSEYKDINKKNLDILLNTKGDILYSIFVTFKTKKDFDEQIQYTIDTLSVIYNNEEYTLDELSKLINRQ